MSKNKKAYVWTASVLVAFQMLFAGLPKIFGGQDWTRNFELWGYPDWMRIIVGLVEVAGAILLVVPRFSLFAAGALTVIMAGAMYTQFIYGSFREAVIPMILFLLLASIVIARWPHPREETGKLNEPIEELNDDADSPLVAK
jgi:uncharacterized membrane protein YphA (DoxX/SURF4 family)